MADGFGRLANVYAGLERLVYGGLLARARFTCLDELSGGETLLIVGEGDGRFLVRMLARHPACAVTVLESSAGMQRRAEARLRAAHLAAPRVTFFREDARTAPLPAAHFDALVTHFFLDVFPEEALARLVPRLDGALKPGGRWFVADFAAPETLSPAPVRLYARFMTALMYGFFRLVTALPARAVAPVQVHLHRAGLEPGPPRRFRGGFVYAQTWRKPGASR